MFWDLASYWRLLVFITFVILAYVVLAFKLPVDDEPQRATFTSRLKAEKARDTTRSTVARKPDAEQLFGIIRKLPYECREDREEQVEGLLEALDMLRCKLTKVETEYSDTLTSRWLTVADCEKMAHAYIEVRDAFGVAWQSLATLRQSIIDEVGIYHPVRIKEARKRCEERLKLLRTETGICAKLLGDSDMSHEIARLEATFGRIEVQLGMTEHTSHAVRQLAWLNITVEQRRADLLRRYGAVLRAYRLAVRETREGSAWLEKINPCASQGELHALNERLMRVASFRTPTEAVRWLHDFRAQAAGIVGSVREAYELRQEWKMPAAA